jgi:glycosyltransferase involved in cell wall biosynthesis
MASTSMPRVTIGLPVYNGAKLVRRAIDSVLQQTAGDLELLISDNCSTDETEEVCRSYAARDPRVVYSKTERNLGAAGNYTRCATLARGEFFKWISHDDWMAPHFIERCLPIAESSSEIITVAPIVDVVDTEGKRVQSVSSYTGRSQWSTNRLEQYRQMMDELAYCETHSDGLMMIAYEYGFHRSSLLRKTRLVMPFISSDYVLAAELALSGRLVMLDAALSQFTLAGGTSSNFAIWNVEPIQRMLAPDRVSPWEIRISVRRRHYEHLHAVLRSPLPPAEKLLALEAATRPMRARAAGRARHAFGLNGAPAPEAK